MGRLDGKIAIITGSARGTGEVTARLFVAEGARVILTDLRDAAGEKVASELGPNARYLHLDVTSESDWAGTVQETERHFGPLNVLVNNAGVLKMAAIEDTELGDFERIVRVNQIGPFLGMKAVIEPMRRQGGGAVVNVTSIDSLQAKNGITAYASSKWGARGLTKAAALELGRYGIRVNAVCPEAGSTDMVAPYIPDGVDPESALAHSHHRLATQKSRSHRERLEDIARMILFLASDESASCSGADFVLDSAISAGAIVRGTPGSA